MLVYKITLRRLVLNLRYSTEIFFSFNFVFTMLSKTLCKKYINRTNLKKNLLRFKLI